MRRAFNPVKPRVPGTVKACVVDLYAQAGGPKRVMVKLQLGESQVYAFADPESSQQLSFPAAAALTGPEAPAAAEYLAALAGGFFQPVAGCSPAGAGALTAESARQHGEMIAALVTALADDKITRAEAQAALPELDEAMRAMCGLRALLLATIDQPPPD